MSSFSNTKFQPSFTRCRPSVFSWLSAYNTLTFAPLLPTGSGKVLSDAAPRSSGQLWSHLSYCWMASLHRRTWPNHLSSNETRVFVLKLLLLLYVSVGGTWRTTAKAVPRSLHGLKLFVVVDRANYDCEWYVASVCDLHPVVARKKFPLIDSCLHTACFATSTFRGAAKSQSRVSTSMSSDSDRNRHVYVCQICIQKHTTSSRRCEARLNPDGNLGWLSGVSAVEFKPDGCWLGSGCGSSLPVSLLQQN